MTTYNIVSRHPKISEAVEASGMDLSFNESEARRDMARMEREGKAGEAFVLERNGEKSVWYRYSCDIQLFNRYEPFHSMLCDTPFSTVEIKEGKVEVSEPRLRRDRSARSIIAKLEMMVTLCR